MKKKKKNIMSSVTKVVIAFSSLIVLNFAFVTALDRQRLAIMRHNADLLSRSWHIQHPEYRDIGPANYKPE